jgi:hypothetical protein
MLQVMSSWVLTLDVAVNHVPVMDGREAIHRLVHQAPIHTAEFDQ